MGNDCDIPVLQVEDLKVSFSIQGMELQAVRGISFDVFEGEALGIVGESGCGKSAAVQAIAGLTPATRVEGKAVFEGADLLREKKEVLGKKIGMVFQDPMTCLNPTMKIGAQIEEGIVYHRMASRKEARARAIELLELTGVPDPGLRVHQYPHQLSGGMRQRVLIAIALACNPRLLIADEPTTALDVTVQAQILQLLKRLQKALRMSMILITHDLGVVAEVCDRVLVLYAGKIVERGKVAEVLKQPRHPYTQMLLDSLPKADRLHQPLRAIDGAPPNLLSPPKGCAFAERCPHAAPICSSLPPFFGPAACWRLKDD
jgi:oligopeptide/dipeptide ABC transporter ATP-binding protein